MFHLNSLNPKTTAILPLDCQKGIFEFLPAAERIVPAAAGVLVAARAKGIPVIHVGIGFHAGYPEIPAEHATFGMIRQTGKFVIGSDSAAFPAALGVASDELVIYKKRVSAFAGNDLEMILRARGIQQLVLFGIATSGIVLSTLRQAADLDFRCMVIEDCCADGDEEVHRVLTKKVFARQAGVVTAEEFVKGLK